MANYIENFGLEELLLTEEDSVKFLGYIAREGKLITGYNGTYINQNLGNAQFILRTALNEKENRYEVTGIDTHSVGKCIWECRVFGATNPSPPGFGPLQRRCLLSPQKTGEGMTIINIVNSEVLPSYLEDDLIKLQVVGFPVLINYFADEESYINHQSTVREGHRRMILPNGTIFPSGFMLNHDPRRDESDRDLALDDHVLIRGTVKKCFSGKTILKDLELTKYVRCIVDTDYGELELVHQYKMVGKDQHEHMHEGAIVSAICVLSGDAAIFEHEDGIVFDEENNLRLLRNCLLAGDVDRLGQVLTGDCLYFVETTDQSISGAVKVIDHFRGVSDTISKDNIYYAHLATVSSLDDCEEEDTPPRYGIGKRCLILAAGTIDHYESIAFLDLDDMGKIKQINLSCDGRYRFKIDRLPHKIERFGEFGPATNAATPILLRAKFAGIIGWTEVIPEKCDEHNTYKNNAELLLEQLATNPPRNTTKAYEALFSYLFAKEIEKRIKRITRGTELTGFDTSYSSVDALSGVIDTDLPEQLRQTVTEGMVEGALLYLGFCQFVSEADPDEETYNRELINSLILVQRLGEIYAYKLVIPDFNK